MTHKFVGEFKFKDNSIVKEVISDTLPDKRLWHDYSIWEFNGKQYRPVTQKAIFGLEDLVKTIQKAGFTKAVKDGKRKPSSIKYAIKTLGVEDFKLI